jgi:hypothetical protein
MAGSNKLPALRDLVVQVKQRKIYMYYFVIRQRRQTTELREFVVLRKSNTPLQTWQCGGDEFVETKT